MITSEVTHLHTQTQCTVYGKTGPDWCVVKLCKPTHCQIHN